MTEKFRVTGAAALVACVGLGLVATLPARAGTQDGVIGAATASGGAGALETVGGFSAALAEGIASDQALSDFYSTRGFAPIWTTAADAGRRAALFAALDDAGAQGLPVARYDTAGLRERFENIRSERERGLLEARMSRVFLTYAQDVSTGALDPKRIDPTIVREIPRRDRLTLIAGFAQAEDPVSYLHDLEPRSPEYAALLRARLDLAAQMAHGGWGPVVPAASLRSGDTGAAVLALRDRLQLMGYLGRSNTARFDGAMEQAVKEFQADQGLKQDGIAAGQTMTGINTPPEERMKAILVAMERLRWMNGLDLGERYIWVNIADFRVRIIDHGQSTFDSVTVVGQAVPDRRTPEFSDQMEMMVINPSWHVPRSITVKEYLPMMQRNPNAAGQIQVLDRAGNVIPREAIDFASYDAGNFPFRMRQDPSDDNALGVVKFLFPNPWNIYLHDTPSKSLFAKQVRAFSHGCIRVGKPLDLAYALLAPQQADPKGYFQRILKTGAETTVRLDQPVPVHLVYFTAWPTPRGHIEYRDDVYGRDAALYAALDKAGVELAPVAD